MNALFNPNDPNVAMLERVAKRLGPQLCSKFAFVGGAVAGLLITDPAHPSIRPTLDVDIVVEVLALTDYHQIENALRERGFAPDMHPDAPLCRWQIDGVTVDVMPTDEAILGFANRWYPMCVSSAQALTLPGGTLLRVIRAPLFVATKLEAFHGRGAGDYLFSHDLGDIVSLLDGRQSLLDECRQMPLDLQTYLGDQFTALLANRNFLDALPGHLPTDPASQRRVGILQAVLRQMAALGKA
ncbi:MAG TPA: hypothetical protein VFW84_05015 [Aquabacterium sp.]|uniref:hypothetical protein n=1 Tax=Aquabacterium sp. TaxID=1872578 RepID=UPI002E3078F6|nr:hypothetical protein [Aquabacterium sp.]HEX5372075.1 hypothetical protein [Aquabacterium sp.]